MSEMDEELQRIVEDAPITAEEALARTEAAIAAPDAGGGIIGRLDGAEAKRLMEMMLGDEFDEDMAAFFDKPAQESDE